MKFSNRDRPTKTAFIISTFSLLFSCCIGALPFTVQPDEMATVVGKSFTYKLPAEMSTHVGYTFKFHTPDSENLPSWLEYDDARHLLLGVPSSHDKGSHAIRLDIFIDSTNKTADTINFLTIEVVEYEEDLNHFKIISSNTLSQPSKNTSQSHLVCASLAPVIVATLVFDLNSRKLSGSNRVELLNSVSEWTATGVDQLRWMPGKGEKTAFNLKDVVVLTAGPGWVKDPQERGVSVSWKIGCGNSITESEKSYVSVGQLKSASQTGAFKNELRSPVVAWHVTYGRVKHRQVVRVRRQALAQTPVPTSAFVTPTSAIVTQVIATPAITYTRSPTVFTVTPTASRIIPSPTQTTGPYDPSVTPIVPVPIPNTPPYISNPIENLTAVIDVPFKFTIPPETFHDREDGQTPNLKLDAYDPKGHELPPDFWLKFDQPSQSVSGTPKALGDTKIALVVTDREGLMSHLLVVTIRVVPETVPPMVKNTPPYLNEAINNLTAVIDVLFKFNIPPDTFHDREDGQTPKLKLDVYKPNGNELPPDFWLKLDQTSQSLSGTPKSLGDTKIALIVTDSKGLMSDLHVVTIRVVVENVPPVLVNHIDLIPLYIGQPLVFKVPVDTFYDKEDGPTPQLRLSMETLEYKTLNSHPWITFDVRSQTIYALPYGDIIGKHEFLMIAYDSNGMKAIDAFEFHINPAPVKPNHHFGLKLDADYKTFKESVTTRVKLCVEVGNYFGDRFNTSYNDIRVKDYRKGSVILEWSFANIATNVTGVEEYKRKYVLQDTEDKPFPKFKEDFVCPISAQCSVTKTWVVMKESATTTPDPNVVGRAEDDDDGTWWEYTIIPAFVIAALIFIIGLIIIICIRCRRKSRLDKNEKVVFVQRKKPAVFREEYPMREVYGNQPLITPNEKAPLPPPAYPRSSTPTEDPSERLLSDSSPSYQPPFDSGHESAGNSRPPVASYRLPPPYVAP